MDLITLALAKKYTDERVGSGGGGSAEIPYFNLRDMIGEISVDGQWHNSGRRDLTELTTALDKGPVRVYVRFKYYEGSMSYTDDAELIVQAGYNDEEYNSDPKNRYSEIHGIAVLDFKKDGQLCPCAYEIWINDNTYIDMRAVPLVDIKDEEQELVFDLTVFGIPDISYLLEGVPMDAMMYTAAYELSEKGAIKLKYNSGGRVYSGYFPCFNTGIEETEAAVYIQMPVVDGATVINGHLVVKAVLTGDEPTFTLQYVPSATA